MKISNNPTDISAFLIHYHKDEIVRLLQREGVMIAPGASDSQIINAYLTTLADVPDFAKKVTDHFYAEPGDFNNVDGSGILSGYYNNTLNPYANSLTTPLSLPNYAAQDQSILNAINSTPGQTINPVTSTNTGGGFGNTIKNILSAPAFNTVLTTLSQTLNNSAQLKQQQNEIRAKMIDYQNNDLLLSHNINPNGVQPKNTSTATKIFIFVGVVLLIGGGIMLISKGKKKPVK